jgi:hypothetical protein
LGVTVVRNFPPLDELTLIGRDDWAKIGRLARERIIRRTLAGRDEDDSAFAPYSAGYAAQKAKAGASGAVNLQLSGAMLEAIQVEPDDDGVTLTIL